MAEAVPRRFQTELTNLKSRIETITKFLYNPYRNSTYKKNFLQPADNPLEL
jgi:hypothetical protein